MPGSWLFAEVNEQLTPMTLVEEAILQQAASVVNALSNRPLSFGDILRVKKEAERPELTEAQKKMKAEFEANENYVLSKKFKAGKVLPKGY